MEGNCYGGGQVGISANTTILGSLILNQNATLSFSTNVSIHIRNCIESLNASLEILISREEVERGEIDVLDDICIHGTFKNVTLKSDLECEDIHVDEADYGNGVHVSFSLRPNGNCVNPALVILIVASIILLTFVAVIVILFVPPIKRAVLPHRDRRTNVKRARNATSTTSTSPSRR